MSKLTPSLSDLLGGLGAEAAQAVQSALIRAVSLGESVASIAKLILDTLGTSLLRALVVADATIMQGYRGATHAAYQASHSTVAGWVWVANIGGSPTPCLACILMHGTKHPLSEMMQSHVRCHCQMVPYFADNPNIAGESGLDWFLQQDAETQQGIMGMARWKLWKAGKVSLHGMVGTHHSSEYGNSIYVKPLKELRTK